MIEHLSYSSINLYLTCPAAWRFRYVEKPTVPKSVNLVFGSAFHEAVENYVGERTEGEAKADLLAHWIDYAFLRLT